MPHLGLGRTVEPVDDLLILAERDDVPAGDPPCGGTDELVDHAVAHGQGVAAGRLARGEKVTRTGQHVGSALAAGRMEPDRVLEAKAGELGVIGRHRVPARIAGEHADVEVVDALVGTHVTGGAAQLPRDDGRGLEGARERAGDDVDARVRKDRAQHAAERHRLLPAVGGQRRLAAALDTSNPVPLALPVAHEVEQTGSRDVCYLPRSGDAVAAQPAA